MHFLPGSRGWYQTWTSFGWNGGPASHIAIVGWDVFWRARLGRQEKGAKRRRAINEKSLPKVNDPVLHYEFCHANLRPTSVKGSSHVMSRFVRTPLLHFRRCVDPRYQVLHGSKRLKRTRNHPRSDRTSHGFRGKLPPLKLARSKVLKLATSCNISLASSGKF